jgi:hypothetical protein
MARRVPFPPSSIPAYIEQSMKLFKFVCVLGHVGSQPEPGPRGPVKFDLLTGREPRRAASAQPTLTIRPVACSRPAGGRRTGQPSAGATGRHGADSDAGPGRIGPLGDHGPCHHVSPGHGTWPPHEHVQDSTARAG